MFDKFSFFKKLISKLFMSISKLGMYGLFLQLLSAVLPRYLYLTVVTEKL